MTHNPAKQLKEKLSRGFLWTATLQVLLFACCDTHTGASEGVTVYEHPNFGGGSHTFSGDLSDFDDISGPCGQHTDPNTGVTTGGDWDNCVSSIMVPPGWEATLYEHDDYEGDTLIVSSNIRDLDDVRGCGNDWDNCATSIRVRRP